MQRSVNHPLSMLAACVLAGVGVAAFNVLPFVVGSAAESFGYSESALGLIASSIVLGMTLSMVALVFLVRRFDWRRLCLAFTTLQILAYLAATQIQTLYALLTLLFVAGVCAGGMFGTAVTSVGDGRDPDRGFGLTSMAQIGVGALGAFLLPRLFLPHGGFSGAMIFLALVSGIGLLVVWGMPRSGRVPQALSGRAATHAKPLVGLLGLIAFYFAIGSIWAFIERIGNDIGLAPAAIGTVLSVALVTGGIGTCVPVILGDRLGRRWPIMLSASLLLVAVGVLTTSSDHGLFMLAAPAFQLAWAVAIVYQAAVVAAVDETGRFVPAIPAAMGIGGAMGPAVGGFFQNQYGIPGLRTVALSMIVINVAIFYWATKSTTPLTGLASEPAANT